MSIDAESTPISDADRLVATLQMCFSDLLKKQEEQGEKFVVSIRRQLTKKTVFWNAYMKLADEHDKEFREKYGTDLDTALIFAGLFSAVSSAFIIQIQPLLIGNVPTVIVVVQALQYISLFTALLAALLAVLGKQWIMYYNTAGSRGTIEERGLERQRKLDGLIKWKFEAVLQMFPLLLQLALLLFATSISIFLFTVHFSIAIIVAALTLFGLGAYCFLLVSATIYPDCPFQTPLMPLLVRVVLPAVIWPVIWLRHTIRALDNLRSALVEFLRALTPPTRFLPRFASTAPSTPTSTDPYSGIVLTPPSPEVPAVLWTLGTSTDPITIGAAAELGLDLQWPVRWDPQSARTVTTRLANTFTSCFEEPLLSDTVRKGMEQIVFPCGRLFCTLHLITYASTSIFLQPTSLVSLFAWKRLETVTAEEVDLIRNIIHKGTVLLSGDWRQSPIARWVLYLSPLHLQSPRFHTSNMKDFVNQFPVDYDQQPSLDLPTFTNYLCCVCSLFEDLDLRTIVQIDKSGLRDTFMIQFFRLILQGSPMAPRILHLTAALNNKLVLSTPRSVRSTEAVLLIEAMLEFCSSLPREHGWLDLVVSAASLTRVGLSDLRDIHSDALQPVTVFHPRTFPRIDTLKLQPVYMALEHVQQQLLYNCDTDAAVWDSETTLAIDGLLQALACNDALPASPSIESLSIILRALSEPTDIAFTAYLLLGRAKAWFLDPRLRPVMHQLCVMHHLGRLVLKYQDSPLVTTSYIKLMQNVATIPEWRSTLWPELPTWIALFPAANYIWMPQAFTSVIRAVWVAEFDTEPEPGFANVHEEFVALTLTALANVWNGVDVSSSPGQIIQLARQTVSTALAYALHDGILPGPSTSMITSYSRLCSSMVRAALNTRAAVSTTTEAAGLPDTQHSPDRLADFVEELAKAVGSAFGPAQWHERGLTAQQGFWGPLRKHLDGMVDAAQEELEGQGAFLAL
ncbi:hypothetical protein C8R46DRAFT_1308584 [Mycena filopes]|nr:hypothetical protein C8R46DRAFT_1308584 [Mycena filopes]